MEICDPVTGERLTIYGFDRLTKEVYGCHNLKIIASIKCHFKVSDTEAIRMLAHSDIHNPVHIGNEEFWAE